MTVDEIHGIAASEPKVAAIAVTLGLGISLIYIVWSFLRGGDTSIEEVLAVFLGGASFVVPLKLIFLCVTAAETISVGVITRLYIVAGSIGGIVVLFRQLMARFSLVRLKREQRPEKAPGKK